MFLEQKKNVLRKNIAASEKLIVAYTKINQYINE